MRIIYFFFFMVFQIYRIKENNNNSYYFLIIYYQLGIIKIICYMLINLGYIVEFIKWMLLKFLICI